MCAIWQDNASLFIPWNHQWELAFWNRFFITRLQIVILINNNYITILSAVLASIKGGFFCVHSGMLALSSSGADLFSPGRPTLPVVFSEDQTTAGSAVCGRCVQSGRVSRQFLQCRTFARHGNTKPLYGFRTACVSVRIYPRLPPDDASHKDSQKSHQGNRLSIPDAMTHSTGMTTSTGEPHS